MAETLHLLSVPAGESIKEGMETLIGVNELDW